MNFKTITFGLIVLVLACCISAVSAEDVSVDDYTFTVPEGFSVNGTYDEDMVVLTHDENHAIVVLISDDIASSSDAISYLEGEGYSFLGEETYDAVNYEVKQQNYELDGFTVLSYVFQVEDDDYCIITYTIPSDETAPEGDANPVTGILETFK